MLRVFLLLILSTTLLPACSVPQYDTAQPMPSETIVELLEHGHYRRALNQLAASPTTQQHDLLLSRIQLGLGEFEGALDLAEKLTAAEPENAAFHVSQVAAVVGEMAVHATMFKQLGLAKRAKKELDAALAIDPKNADAIYGLVLYDENAPSFIGGDKAVAQKLAEQLTGIDPARGYLAQASLAHDHKDATAEEALLRKAVAADAKNYEAQIGLATFLERVGASHADEADEHACLALELDLNTDGFVADSSGSRGNRGMRSRSGWPGCDGGALQSG